MPSPADCLHRRNQSDDDARPRQPKAACSCITEIPSWLHLPFPSPSPSRSSPSSPPPRAHLCLPHRLLLALHLICTTTPLVTRHIFMTTLPSIHPPHLQWKAPWSKFSITPRVLASSLQDLALPTTLPLASIVRVSSTLTRKRSACRPFTVRILFYIRITCLLIFISISLSPSRLPCVEPCCSYG